MNFPTQFRVSKTAKNRKILWLFAWLYAFLLVNFTYGQFPEKQENYVNDFAQVLSADENYRLEALLRDFEKQTTYELALATVSSLDGYDVQQYAFELSEKWQIGKKASNNGILVLLAPNERKVNISTGYGVESILTDAICKRIITKVGVPYFKTGSYAEGLAKLTDEIVKVLTDGAYRQKNYAVSKNKLSTPLILLIILMPLLLVFLLSKRSKTYSNTGGASSTFFPFTGGGGFRDRSDGGSGFGGFGGGSFGGGGSSGSW